MKSLHLKLMLLGAFGFLAWNKCSAQQIAASHPHLDANMTVSCGVDTVAYPLLKSTGNTSVSLIKGDIEGLAQFYELPAAADISGITFWANVKDDLHIGKTALVTVRVYAAGTDSLPQGVPLSLATVTVDTTLQAYKVPFITSIALPGDYLVSVEYGAGLTDTDTLIMQLNAVGDGGDESLGAGLYNSGGNDVWLDFEHLIPDPDRDAMIFPWVSYSLTTDFTSPGDSVCVDEPLLFANTSTAFAMSRMYNKRIYNPASFGAAFYWSFGDGTFASDEAPTKTYTATGAYSVLLTTTITSYHGECSEPATAAIVVQPRALANFQSSSSIVTEGDTVTFTDMSSGGSCSWDFGDGSATVPNCGTQSHVYNTAGIYIASLTITSPYGCSETYSDTIFVQTATGVASATSAIGFQLWPNPVNSSKGGDQLHIRWAHSSPTVVRLYDLQGRVLKQQQLNSCTNLDWSMAELPAGVMVLQVQQGERRTQQRVVLVH